MLQTSGTTRQPEKGRDRQSQTDGSYPKYATSCSVPPPSYKFLPSATIPTRCKAKARHQEATVQPGFGPSGKIPLPRATCHVPPWRTRIEYGKVFDKISSKHFRPRHRKPPARKASPSKRPYQGRGFPATPKLFSGFMNIMDYDLNWIHMA